MSLEFVENVVVKEEYVVDESNLNLFDSQATQDHSDIKIKCGEVFMGQNGYNLTFVCAQCLQSFPDLPSFGEHIWNTHHKDKIRAPIAPQGDTPSLKAEPKSDVDEEDESIVQNKPMDLEDYQEPSSTKKPITPKRIHRNCGTAHCCFSCGLTFVDFLRYRKHYRTDHPDMIERDDSSDIGSSDPTGFIPKVPEEMICRYCLKAFHEPSAYHVHITSDHTVKIYSCLNCPKTFRHRHSRDHHRNIHDGRKPFQCPHCPKAFSSPPNLRSHVHIHLNIKPYSCQYCGQKYVQKSALKIHERIHTKEKPYQCDECGMSFIAQIKLTHHMLRHKNIKNFKCPHCEKLFFSSHQRSNHIRTHTGEKPFNCDICGKKFRARGHLRTHKLLHSDERRYECKLCGKLFAQHAGWYSHMKSHGEIKNSNS